MARLVVRGIIGGTGLGKRIIIAVKWRIIAVKWRILWRGHIKRGKLSGKRGAKRVGGVIERRGWRGRRGRWNIEIAVMLSYPRWEGGGAGAIAGRGGIELISLGGSAWMGLR